MGLLVEGKKKSVFKPNVTQESTHCIPQGSHGWRKCPSSWNRIRRMRSRSRQYLRCALLNELKKRKLTIRNTRCAFETKSDEANACYIQLYLQRFKHIGSSLSIFQCVTKIFGKINIPSVVSPKYITFLRLFLCALQNVGAMLSRLLWCETLQFAWDSFLRLG